MKTRLIYEKSFPVDKPRKARNARPTECCWCERPIESNKVYVKRVRRRSEDVVGEHPLTGFVERTCMITERYHQRCWFERVWHRLRELKPSRGTIRWSMYRGPFDI